MATARSINTNKINIKQYSERLLSSESGHSARDIELELSPNSGHTIQDSRHELVSVSFILVSVNSREYHLGTFISG